MSKRRGIVWILGAGFSRYLGAPLLSELLTHRSLRRVRAIYRHTAGVSGALHDADGITELFSWGLDQERRHWQNAEEFLEQLDYAVKDDVRRRTFGAVLSEFTRPAQGSSLGAMAHKMKMPSGVLVEVDKFEEGKVEDLRFAALRLAAAEVSGFLEGADPKLERWAPYRAWAASLDQSDTVLTFNYDLVLETLSRAIAQQLRILGFSLPEPGGPWGAQVVKMHGSVDWHLQDPKGNGSWDKIERSGGTIVTTNSVDKIAMATPGPRKNALIEGPFKSLWATAARAIAHAEALVFCGYRMPPTDAGTKQWLVDQLGGWLNNTPPQPNPNVGGAYQDVLPIHIVLGPRDDEGHAHRLVMLLSSIDVRFKPKVWPMGAEDYLGLLTRERLLALPTR